MARWGRREWQTSGSGLLVSLGQVVLLLAAAFGIGWLQAYGPDNWLGAALEVVLWLVAGALWLSSVFVAPLSFVGFLSNAALMITTFGALSFLPQLALAERGQTASCVVLKVDHRAVTTSHYEADSSGNGGTWHTTTTDYYDHQLDCVGGRPRALTTTGKAAGHEGATIQVVYDPTNRLEPLVAAETSSPYSRMVVLGIELLATVGLRIAPIAVEACRRRRFRPALSRTTK